MSSARRSFEPSDRRSWRLITRSGDGIAVWTHSDGFRAIVSEADVPDTDDVDHRLVLTAFRPPTFRKPERPTAAECAWIIDQFSAGNPFEVKAPDGAASRDFVLRLPRLLA